MITREQFMEFFRSDEFHNTITPDDAVEIFSSVLHGESDITEELVNRVLTDYNSDLIVLPTKDLEVIKEGRKAIKWSYIFIILFLTALIFLLM